MDIWSESPKLLKKRTQPALKKSGEKPSWKKKNSRTERETAAAANQEGSGKKNKFVNIFWPPKRERETKSSTTKNGNLIRCSKNWGWGRRRTAREESYGTAMEMSI